MASRRTSKSKTGETKTPKYMAFLSYSRKDNDTDGKWITDAAQRLSAYVRRATGREFPVFVDFLDTPIGLWKESHQEVLDSAPFLIVFVTPCFLKSAACRREVNRFSKGSGLIIPIFYIACEAETAPEKRLHARLVQWQGEPWMGMSEKCGPKSKLAGQKLVVLANRIKKAMKSGAPAAPASVVARRHVSRKKTGKAASTAREAEMTGEARSRQVKAGLEFVGNNALDFEEYRSPIDGAEMVKIPAGRFKMGSTESGDEKPMHEVFLRGYCIGKYAVTNAQYRKFCDATGRDYPPDPGFSSMPDYFTKNADYPVVNVSWEDARAYCEWAGKRLPTEAEWEKAARGQDGRKYPWGNEEPDGTQCNFADKRSGMPWADKSVDDGYAHTSPVKKYPAGASPYGVTDMAGNVWDWCNDWYADHYYKRSPGENPKGPDSGSDRVLRGGSWDCLPGYLRCACRSRCGPSGRVNNVGFRCAVDV